jgi:hypothetical protein
MLRGTRFADLQWRRRTEESWQHRGGSGGLQRRWGRPLVALQLWNWLLRQRSGSDNLLRGLARRGKLRVGTTSVAWFGNGSGNGKKCSWGCSGAPICRPKSPAQAEHHPGDPLQLNRRFVTRLLRIWGKSHNRFRWGIIFPFRFCGCCAEEGNRALGRIPGQA